MECQCLRDVEIQYESLNSKELAEDLNDSQEQLRHQLVCLLSMCNESDDHFQQLQLLNKEDLAHVQAVFLYTEDMHERRTNGLTVRAYVQVRDHICKLYGQNSPAITPREMALCNQNQTEYGSCDIPQNMYDIVKEESKLIEIYEETQSMSCNEEDRLSLVSSLRIADEYDFTFDMLEGLSSEEIAVLANIAPVLRNMLDTIADAHIEDPKAVCDIVLEYLRRVFDDGNDDDDDFRDSRNGMPPHGSKSLHDTWSYGLVA